MTLEPTAPLVIALPVLAGLAVLSVVIPFRAARPGRASALAALRVLAILALAGGLVRPMVAARYRRPQQGAASDPRGDNPAAPPPRAERGPAAAPGFVLTERGETGLPSEAASRLAGLAREGLIHEIAFPGGSESGHALRSAMKEAFGRCGATPRAVLLVLGRSARDPSAAALAARLGMAGAAVSAVVPCVEAPPGLSLSPVRLRPREPRAGGPVVAEAELESRLSAATPVEVRWSLDGRSLVSRGLELPAGTTRTRIEHALAVPTSGFHRVRVEVAPLSRELDRSDNAAGAFLLARPGPRRALIVEGMPREAYRAVRRALEADDGFRVRASSTVERARRSRLLPREGRGWEGLDLVVLGDLSAAEFGPGALERLARFVRDGGGLVVIAGRRNLGPGGWGATALARVLPVKVRPDDREIPGPLDVRPAGRVGEARPFPFGAGWVGGPGGGGGRGVPARSRAASWRALAELARARAVAEVKEGARVPVIAVRPGLEVPLLVERRAGTGRVAVVLSDDLACWARSSRAARLAHDEFWRDVARGAARASPDEGPRVWMECAPGGGFGPETGRPLAVTVYLADSSARASVEIEHRDAGGARASESLKLAPRGLVRTFEIRPRAPGSILFRARAFSGRIAAESAPLEVEVAPPRPGASPRAVARGPGTLEDYEALRAACHASGGVLSTVDSAPAAVEAFIEGARSPVVEFTAERRAPLGEAREALPAGAWLALFVALVVAEWTLRREWGMP